MAFWLFWRNESKEKWITYGNEGEPVFEQKELNPNADTQFKKWWKFASSFSKEQVATRIKNWWIEMPDENFENPLDWLSNHEIARKSVQLMGTPWFWDQYPNDTHFTQLVEWWYSEDYKGYKLYCYDKQKWRYINQTPIAPKYNKW